MRFVPHYRQSFWQKRQWRRWIVTAAALAVTVTLIAVADRHGWFGTAPSSDMDRYDGKQVRVVHVVDGDTLDVDIPDGTNACTRVRLWGVDTPETVHPERPVEFFGPEASAFTRRLAEGQTIRLELLPQRTRGTKGRLLAFIHLPDHRILNAELISQGYGFADPRFPHPHLREYAAQMQAAQQASIGMWTQPDQVTLPAYLRN